MCCAPPPRSRWASAWRSNSRAAERTPASKPCVREEPMASRKTPESPAGPREPSLTFEAALERLRTIVEELERGELTLDESIARYEEGMKLSKWLTQQLDDAEKRIERLIAGDDKAPPTTQPMEFEPRGG